MKLIRNRRGGTGMGVIAGILGTILVLALAMGIAMLAMGRCPMCGGMMN